MDISYTSPVCALVYRETQLLKCSGLPPECWFLPTVADHYYFLLVLALRMRGRQCAHRDGLF